MKTIAFILYFTAALSVGLNAKEPVTNANAKCNILVVGFQESNIFTYYPKSEVAKKCKISADSIYHEFNRLICENLLVESQKYNFIPLSESKNIAGLLQNVEYTLKPFEKKTSLYSINLNSISKNQIRQLLTVNKADYVIFANYYEYNWEGDPYNSLKHNIHFQIINREMEIIDSDIISFLTNDLSDIDGFKKKIKKKFDKEFKKISAQIVPIENTAQAMR